MIDVDAKGRLTSREHPATNMDGLAGAYFKRRDPVGDDAGDIVVACGAVDVGGDAGPAVELVIQAAAGGFGSVPAADATAWDGEDSMTSIDMDTFAEQYRRLDDGERAVLRGDEFAASVAATKDPNTPRWPEARA
jgi:hypothetical protein